MECLLLSKKFEKYKDLIHFRVVPSSGFVLSSWYLSGVLFVFGNSFNHMHYISYTAESSNKTVILQLIIIGDWLIVTNSNVQRWVPFTMLFQSTLQ